MVSLEEREDEITEHEKKVWDLKGFRKVRIGFLELKKALIQNGKKYGKHQYVLPTIIAYGRR